MLDLAPYSIAYWSLCSVRLLSSRDKTSFVSRGFLVLVCGRTLAEGACQRSSWVFDHGTRRVTHRVKNRDIRITCIPTNAADERARVEFTECCFETSDIAPYCHTGSITSMDMATTAITRQVIYSHVHPAICWVQDPQMELVCVMMECVRREGQLLPNHRHYLHLDLVCAHMATSCHRDVCCSVSMTPR